MTTLISHKFPYFRISRNSDNPLLQFKNEPLLPVGLANEANQMVKVLAYIDTGAQWCLFNNEYAAQLGIKDYKATENHFSLSGIGGSNANTAYFHDLTLLVFKDNKNRKRKNAYSIETKVGFVEKKFGVAGVLGVYGFLDRFSFTGNIPEHYFEISPMF